MKAFFFFGIAGLILFEIIKVYFIMPFPGSQHDEVIALSYFLFSYRWIFRIIFFILIVAGFKTAWLKSSKWLLILLMLIAIAVCWFFNFKALADKMFLQPEHLVMKNKTENKVSENQQVIAIEINGEAKAYPIEFLTFHHQVQDSIGGKKFIATYCSVCRSGRFFEPTVNGKEDKFRLVGMDHFNAMFEDATTKSWWRQENGEAIAGSLKGKFLPELPCMQLSIKKYFELFPDGLVMQPDSTFKGEFDADAKYEQGKYSGGLTGTDSASWKNKSWVVGVTVGKESKVYDWNELKKVRIINDSIGNKNIMLALSSDDKSFIAFERPTSENFHISNDTLFTTTVKYDFAGRNYTSPNDHLNMLNAYQEFWHSWNYFHPKSKKIKS